MAIALFQIFMSLHGPKCIKGGSDANNTHGLTVFLVTRSLLRLKEEEVKDFRLNCLCETRS